MGAGDWRLHAVPIDQAGYQLLRLGGDEKSSAEKVMRMPISKQRNKHIQGVLIEAAKLAPSDARLLGHGCFVMLDVTRNDLLFLEM